MTFEQQDHGLVITPQKMEYNQALDASAPKNGSAENAPFDSSDLEYSIIHILYSGVGPEATRSSLHNFLETRRPDWAIVTGFCGSLERSLNTGDVLLARRVFSHPELETSKRVPAGGKRVNTILNQDHRLKNGSLVTVPDPVFQRRSKRSLKKNWGGCHAVDTETAVAGHLLAEHGVPMIAARVVLDKVTDDLSFMENLIRERPEPTAREVFSHVLRHPDALVPFANLSRKYLIASRRLRQFLVDLFRNAEKLSPDKWPGKNGVESSLDRLGSF